jgi:[acyl-carrier-protein] S-malonyltransferase
MVYAVVFPGQGSQRFGMAKDFFDKFAVSRDVFAEADATLGYSVSDMCFGQDPRLHLTTYTQPCLLAAEIAMFRALVQELGVPPAYFGGHSAGEYTALVAAGALPFSATLKLLKARGRLMQEAVPEGKGAMAALVMDDISYDMVHSIAAQFEIDVANDNASNQVVLSGLAEHMERLREALPGLLAQRRHRLVALNVSAPFHSRHMLAIEAPFSHELDLALADGGGANGAAAQVTSNHSGNFHGGNCDELKSSLMKQASSTVRWRANMSALLSKCSSIIEVGPGKPLTGFFKSMGVEIQSVCDVDALARLKL